MADFDLPVWALVLSRRLTAGDDKRMRERVCDDFGFWICDGLRWLEISRG